MVIAGSAQDADGKGAGQTASSVLPKAVDRRTGSSYERVGGSISVEEIATTQMARFGDSLASSESEALLAAQAELRSAAEAIPTDAPNAGARALEEAAEPPRKAAGREDIMKRIAAAKAYKEELSSSGNVGQVPIPAAGAAPSGSQTPRQGQRSDEDTSVPSLSSPPPFSGIFGSNLKQSAESGGRTEPPPQLQQFADVGASAVSDDSASTGTGRTERRGFSADSTGSADSAANYLQGVFNRDPDQAIEGIAGGGLRPEVVTEILEYNQRSRGAEVISIDKDYKPKVSTWGVFNRPRDISKTFGGGRRLQPDDLKETPEEAQARKKRISDALKQYRLATGMEVDPNANAVATKLFNSGLELFEKGELAPALEMFDSASKEVHLRTPIGGEIGLHRAICLDSVGRTDEALAVYTSLTSHPSGKIAKRAKQLVYGIKAMDFLKTRSISYSVTKGAYDEYFNRLSGPWNMTYSASKDDAVDNRMVTVLATSVMVLPLVFLGGLVLGN